jgi:hypothetical protein
MPATRHSRPTGSAIQDPRNIKQNAPACPCALACPWCTSATSRSSRCHRPRAWRLPCLRTRDATRMHAPRRRGGRVHGVALRVCRLAGAHTHARTHARARARALSAHACTALPCNTAVGPLGHRPSTNGLLRWRCMALHGARRSGSLPAATTGPEAPPLCMYMHVLGFA